MAYLQQAVEEFCRHTQLDRIDVPASGEVQFRLGDQSLLGFAQVEDMVVVHWSQPLCYDIAETLLHAMKFAGAVREARQAVQVGLRHTPSASWLVLATRFPEADVSVERIREAFDFLRHWRQELQAHA